jgi:hypothetical protein
MRLIRNMDRLGGMMMTVVANPQAHHRRAVFLDAIFWNHGHTSSSICMSMDEARAEKTSLSAVGLENKVEDNWVSVLTHNIEWQNTRQSVRS